VAAMSEKELSEVPGIGKDLAGKIHEFIETGKISKHEELKIEIPAGILELLKVPGLGPKKAMMLFQRLGVKGVGDLEKAIRDGRLTGLPGIQKKTEENILKGIELLTRVPDRRPLGRVLPLANDIVRLMKEKAPVDRIVVAGSIRRRKETVRDIDILTTSRRPGKVMEVFVSLPHVGRILMQGPTKSTIITDDGVQVDIRVVEEASFGAALVYFTGSKQHNIRLREMAVRLGLKINEYGIFTGTGEKRVGGKKEEDVYKALRLPNIPPELREDTGEIEAALEGKLPALVKPGDIRGDLHAHTRSSDGSHDLDAVVRAAQDRGYEYVAITDHTKGLGVAHGLDEHRLMEDILLIDKAKGTEIDIRSDGRLDLADYILTGLDIVVASVHSGFSQTEEQITKRLLTAIRHPCVSVIAHPTGRLIGERDAYAVDMEAVLKEAAKYGVAMEINAYPLRLDLSDVHVRMARDLGVPIVISTDMHVLNQFDFMSYGVSIARRGWLEKKDVLNTLPYEKLIKRLRSCKTAKAKRMGKKGK